MAHYTGLSFHIDINDTTERFFRILTRLFPPLYQDQDDEWGFYEDWEIHEETNEVINGFIRDDGMLTALEIARLMHIADKFDIELYERATFINIPADFPSDIPEDRIVAKVKRVNQDILNIFVPIAGLESDVEHLAIYVKTVIANLFASDIIQIAELNLTDEQAFDPTLSKILYKR